jgi:hypothetical protein
MLSDRQDKRLGFGQPSQLHATAGFAEYAGMLDSPFVVAVTNAQHSATHMDRAYLVVPTSLLL